MLVPQRAAAGGKKRLTFAYWTGNQTANITVTASSGIVINPTQIETWINGNFTQDTSYFPTVALNGTQWVLFAFAGPVVVNEVSYWQQAGGPWAQGTWQWQGSNDNVNFANIGATFALAPGTTYPQIITTLAANATAYRYYRMLGMSGSTNTQPWVYQFQFKVGH